MTDKMQLFQENLYKWLTRLLLFIALSAFLMTFRQLMESAWLSGKSRFWEYWTFPLLLDGGVLLFTLTALWLTILESWWRWTARGMVLVFTAISVLVNYIHAAGSALDSPVLLGLTEPQLIAILPPVVYFVCVEAFLGLLHLKIKQEAQEAERIDLEALVDKLRSEVDGLSTTIQALEDRRDNIQAEVAALSEVELRNVAFAGAQAAGLSIQEISRRTGLSPSGVHKGLTKAKKRLNGQIEALQGKREG